MVFLGKEGFVSMDRKESLVLETRWYFFIPANTCLLVNTKTESRELAFVRKNPHTERH